MSQASPSTFKSVIKGYRDNCGNSMVLGWIVDKFSARNYSENAAAMVTLARQAKASRTGLLGVFGKLARGFQAFPPPQEQRMLVLNEVWKYVTKVSSANSRYSVCASSQHPSTPQCEDITSYITCATEWLEVVLLHYSPLELSVLMRDIVKHLQRAEGASSTSGGQGEELARALDPLVQLLVRHSYDYNGAILKGGELLQILDKFKNSHKADHSKELLETFNKNSEETDDPVLINTLFEVSRALHDSLDSLTPEGEQRHVASLINGFIEKVRRASERAREASERAQKNISKAFCRSSHAR